MLFAPSHLGTRLPNRLVAPACSEFKRLQKLAQKEATMAEKKVRLPACSLPPPPAGAARRQRC